MPSSSSSSHHYCWDVVFAMESTWSRLDIATVFRIRAVCKRFRTASCTPLNQIFLQYLPEHERTRPISKVKAMQLFALGAAALRDYQTIPILDTFYFHRSGVKTCIGSSYYKERVRPLQNKIASCLTVSKAAELAISQHGSLEKAFSRVKLRTDQKEMRRRYRETMLTCREEERKRRKRYIDDSFEREGLAPPRGINLNMRCTSAAAEQFRDAYRHIPATEMMHEFTSLHHEYSCLVLNSTDSFSLFMIRVKLLVHKMQERERFSGEIRDLLAKEGYIVEGPLWEFFIDSTDYTNQESMTRNYKLDHFIRSRSEEYDSIFKDTKKRNTWLPKSEWVKLSRQAFLEKLLQEGIVL